MVILNIYTVYPQNSFTTKTVIKSSFHLFGIFIFLIKIQLTYHKTWKIFSTKGLQYSEQDLSKVPQFSVFAIYHGISIVIFQKLSFDRQEAGFESHWWSVASIDLDFLLRWYGKNRCEKIIFPCQVLQSKPEDPIGMIFYIFFFEKLFPLAQTHLSVI